MDTSSKTARVAGWLYLVTVVTGIFSLIYVPSRISANGDATLVVNNIVTFESLFRSGVAAGALGYVAFLILPLALYKLLGSVNKAAAVLMVTLAVVQVPIYFVAIANQLDVLSLLAGAKYLKAFTPEELHAKVMFLMDAYDNLVFASEIFWGLWLLPFGYLVFKSGFLPKFLGVLLMLGCFSYLVDFFARLLFPHYSVPGVVTLPAARGEIGICLWLVVMGTRRPRHIAG